MYMNTPFVCPDLKLKFKSRQNILICYIVRIKGDSSNFFTGCLNDFSLYVFHPYGAGRKQRPEDMVFSPLTSEERKDSLSVHVAFVKFHLSRSRRYNFRPRTAASSWAFWSLGPNKPQGVGIRRYMPTDKSYTNYFSIKIDLNWLEKIGRNFRK